MLASEAVKERLIEISTVIVAVDSAIVVAPVANKKAALAAMFLGAVLRWLAVPLVSAWLYGRVAVSVEPLA